MTWAKPNTPLPCSIYNVDRHRRKQSHFRCISRITEVERSSRHASTGVTSRLERGSSRASSAVPLLLMKTQTLKRGRDTDCGCRLKTRILLAAFWILAIHECHRAGAWRRAFALDKLQMQNEQHFINTLSFTYTT